MCQSTDLPLEMISAPLAFGRAVAEHVRRTAMAAWTITSAACSSRGEALLLRCYKRWWWPPRGRWTVAVDPCERYARAVSSSGGRSSLDVRVSCRRDWVLDKLQVAARTQAVISAREPGLG